MFQCFFQPLKRSDIRSIRFQEVLKKIGLYFDPSFYLPSNTTLIVFFILFALMFFTTVFIGILIRIFKKQEIRKESRRRSAIFVITVDLD
ncbi:MAG: hypothetical protein EZS28_049182, partial [Streblomastix strix]